MQTFLSFCGVYFLIGLSITVFCIYKDDRGLSWLAVPFIVIWPLIVFGLILKYTGVDRGK